jgi:RNA polymerase sigma-70 factor (ECF subfamily)
MNQTTESTVVPDTDERALMQRAQDGDRTAFARLFKRHADRLWRMSYLLLHSSDGAEDAVQETFKRGLARIETYRGEGAPRGWFSTIALNICREFLRHESVEAALASPEVLDAGQRVGRPRTRGVLTSVCRRERNRQLAIALGYLTQPQREAFVLHYAEELPYEEIGGILDVSAGAARILAFRAKAALRERLKPASPTAH